MCRQRRRRRHRCCCCYARVRPRCLQVRQLFERFPCASASAAPDARFEFFKAHVWPRLAEGAGGGLLLVVPNYFDFVRVR